MRRSAQAGFSVLGLALAIAGCGGPVGQTQLVLSWRFADGRRCAEAGALQVTVAAKSGAITCAPASCNLLCSDGESMSGVQLTVPARDVELDLAATSPSGDVLYRGTLPFGGPVPPAATAELYFTGGK